MAEGMLSDTDTDCDTDTGTNPDTGDSGDDDDDVGGSGDPGSPFFDVSYFTVTSEFGYDAVSGTFVNVGTPYGSVAPAITMRLGSAEWEADAFSATSPHYCFIDLPLTSAAQPGWLQPGMWFGADYDVAASPLSDCNTPGYELDPALWGTSIAVDLATYGWGVAVGPLQPQYGGGGVGPETFNGFVNNVMLPAPEGQQGYLALAFEIDPLTFELRCGTFMPILAANVPVPGADIVSGFYQLAPVYVWTFQ